MFTGIVTSLGRIVELAPHHLVIDAPGVREELGASVAVDGCCLTVTTGAAAPADLAPHPGAAPVPTTRIAFDILPETLAATRLGALAPGAAINLEPALRAGQPLGGHLVQGHVDTTGTVRRATTGPGARWLDLELDVPAPVLDLCIEKGSITVNGVSLTIMAVDPDGIRLQLIPETQTRTNLGSLASGDLVNLEADVIARYVARLLPANR